MNDFEVNTFLDVKLRLDHTLSQSTEKLRPADSLFQIVLKERGFVMQSIISLYIKETDSRPADGAIQSRIGWEEMGEDQGTPYALRAERNWRKTKYADAGRQNCNLNVWNEQRPWLSYISPHMFTPKDQEGWTNGRFLHTKLKLSHRGVTKFEGSSYPTFNRFPDFNRVSHNRTKCIIIHAYPFDEAPMTMMAQIQQHI